LGLDEPTTIDFLGTETSTGTEVLTIADSWDWADEGEHLLALQSKVNACIEFVESGQLLEERPWAAGQPCRIEILSRFPFPTHLEPFLAEARRVASGIGVSLEQRQVSIPDAAGAEPA
jgi:hypothetical protein